MATIATLAVKLIADAAGFISTMDQAEKKSQAWSANVSKNLKEVGGKITDFGKIATAGLTLPIIGAGVAAIKMASDMEETRSKVNVVFGSMSKDVMAWSENAATAMGMSKEQALGAAASYGNLFLTLGLGQKPAADMSTALVGLASDLASFNNANPEEVLQALQSGLIGQAEPMRKFGVNLNEAAVAAKALEMGLVPVTQNAIQIREAQLKANDAQEAYNKALAWYGDESEEAAKAGLAHAKAQLALEEAMAGNVGELTEAAKVQARYALILEQTTTAQGDFARTADGLANSTRIAKAQLADAAVVLGQQLLPYGLQLVQWVSKAIGWFQQLTPEQQKWIVIILGTVAVIGPLLVVIGSLVTAIGAIIPIITAVAGALAPFILPILAIIAVLALLYLAWTNNWGGIQQKTQATIEFVKGLIAGGMQFINDLTSGKLGWLSQLWNNTLAGIQIWWLLFTTNIKLILQAFTAAFHGDWYRFGELMRMAWDNMWTGIKAILEIAWQNIRIIFSTMITNIIAFFRDTDWGEVGNNIVQGIANGLTQNLRWIIDAARAAAQAALDAAMGFLGIHSPSKVFEMQVGMQMAAGMALGWERGLEKMLQPSFGALLPEASAAVSGQPSAVSGGGGRRGAFDEDERVIELLEEIAKKGEFDYQKLARIVRDAVLMRSQ